MIKSLLNIEFLKFRKNIVIIVLTILFAAFMLLILFRAKDLVNNMPPPFPSSSIIYEFPTVWDYQGYVANWLVSFLMGFMMIFVVTSEVSNKTMRQCIINGWTRKQYWLSKVYVLLMLALFSTLFYILSTLLIGFVYTDGIDLELLLDNNFAVLRFFVMCVGYLSFAFLIGTWIRKGTLAILIYFAYIMFVEQIIRGIHLYYFKNSSVLYYPINIIEDNMPNPIFHAPDNFLAKDLGFYILLPYWQSGILTVVISILMLGLTYRLIQKRDL